ncbi:MAG: hypothetical protein PHD65_02935 [Gallionella sp.]|nr:hypothetical protein [Gallionella sp.]
MDIENNRGATSVSTFSPFEKSVYVILGLASIGSLSIGKFLHINSEGASQSFWAHFSELFFTEVGIAGFVALALIATIERFTRDKHERAADSLIERIKTNLFHAIYRRHIPQEIFEEVEHCLLTKNVIRRNYIVNFWLREITAMEAANEGITQDDMNNHLFCELSPTYELENISEGRTATDICVSLERPIDENLLKFVRIESVKVDGVPVDISNSCEFTSTHVQLKHEISIPAKSKTKIAIRAHTIKRKTDSEIWASILPSDGIKLEVSAPKSISVHAYANHSKKLTYESFEGGMRHVWELEHGIFPYQSVIFWWKGGVAVV